MSQGNRGGALCLCYGGLDDVLVDLVHVIEDVRVVADLPELHQVVALHDPRRKHGAPFSG